MQPAHAGLSPRAGGRREGTRKRPNGDCRHANNQHGIDPIISCCRVIMNTIVILQRLNWTVVHEASDRGHADVIRVLAMHGAPLNGKTDVNLSTI